ncbi:MAG: cupin domain-containing protein [Thermoplasmata archaeon]|nr:cupin domain-containing protein [Thermoplasmata archaeon]MCI4362421.1 cupin domain-containing protein [Thermoplasmata archaeon]
MALRPIEDVARQARSWPDPYVEFLRQTSMSAGVYVLPAGATDRQSPHRQDELYYVTKGRGRFRQGAEERAVGAGDALFVPAGEPHRFFDIEEELVLLVVFAPPEGAGTARGGEDRVRTPPP